MYATSSESYGFYHLLTQVMVGMGLETVPFKIKFAEHGAAGSESGTKTTQSMVLIHQPLDYGPSMLSLHHSAPYRVTFTDGRARS